MVLSLGVVLLSRVRSFLLSAVALVASVGVVLPATPAAAQSPVPAVPPSPVPAVPPSPVPATPAVPPNPLSGVPEVPPTPITISYASTLSGGLTVASAASDLVLQPGRQVRYARLYWWGSFPAPERDTVTLTLPGTAEGSIVQGKVTQGTEAFLGVADITGLVNRGGVGRYQVAAEGWTLLVVYASDLDPVRRVTVAEGWDRVGELSLTAGLARVGWVGPGIVSASVGSRPVLQGDTVAASSQSMLRAASPALIGALYASIDIPLPELSVDVTVKAETPPVLGNPVIPGALLSFTFDITASRSADAVNVRAGVPIPEHTSFLAGSGTTSVGSIVNGVVSDGQMWVQLGAVPAGARVKVVMDVKVNTDADGQKVSSSAAVLYAPKPMPSLTRIAIGTFPGLEITPAANLKVANTAAVGGGALRYTIKITNVGPSTARRVVLHDTVHESLGLPDPVPSCTFAGQLLECQLGDLAAGESREVIVVVRPKKWPTPGSRIPNAASVSSETLDPDSASNTKVVTTTL